MTLSIGLLSTARINADLAAGARASSRARVVAIASRDLARAQAQASELGVERAHGSYEALLADREIDAVYVSLPNELHHEWTLRALAAGKHVLCEKPYSRLPGDVQEAFAAADAAGLVLAEALMWRHHPQALRLEELVTGGAIGELRMVRAAFSFMLKHPKDARLLTEPAGGGLMDVGCYCVSAARMLAGEPMSATAQQLVTPSGLDRRLAATLAHERDVLTHFDCALDLPERSELEAIGSEGVLRVSDPWHSISTGIELKVGDRRPEYFDVPDANPYACELDDFAAAVAGEHSPRLGLSDALGQARTIEAVLNAAEGGRRVML
jgi:predicted dehydrogenase